MLGLIVVRVGRSPMGWFLDWDCSDWYVLYVMLCVRSVGAVQADRIECRLAVVSGSLLVRTAI